MRSSVKELADTVLRFDMHALYSALSDIFGEVENDGVEEEGNHDEEEDERERNRETLEGEEMRSEKDPDRRHRHHRRRHRHRRHRNRDSGEEGESHRRRRRGRDRKRVAGKTSVHSSSSSSSSSNPREEMQAVIERELRRRRPDAPPAMISALPSVSRQVEQWMFVSLNARDYMDVLREEDEVDRRRRRGEPNDGQRKEGNGDHEKWEVSDDTSGADGREGSEGDTTETDGTIDEKNEKLCAVLDLVMNQQRGGHDPSR